MILLDNLKPLKIYKRPLFLPTLENDKKKGSAIFLLTPNYESSKELMTSNLTINKLRFASYYIEKDLTYFISSKVMNKVDDVTESYVRGFTESDFYHSLCEMSTAERNKLKDSDFGLPKQRKYPMDSKEHIKSAIKFFNYVDESDEKELARNLNKAIKKYFKKSEYPNVGIKNRFSKYYSIKESVNKDYVTEEGIVRHVYDLTKDILDGNPVDINDSDSFCPVKLANIPNYMGINICSVQSVEWSELQDGQLIDIVIKFIPSDSNEIRETTISEYAMKESLINESYNITSERGFYHYDGTYNCIVNVTGVDKPLRGRGEILILDPTGTKIYLVFKDDKKYKVPGGGFEPNESHLEGTLREAKEEARLEVVAAYDTGVRYVEMFKDDVDKTQAGFDPENRFYGFYTEVFVGTAVDTYTGDLDTVDVDEFMTTGEFYDIDEVYDKLTPEHKKALNSVIKEDVNLSNLTAYHLDIGRKGKNAKDIGAPWDEELYSKSLDYAIINDICSCPEDIVKNAIKKRDKLKVNVYTHDEELNAIYLGKLTIRFFDITSNSNPNRIYKYGDCSFDWEWAETENISQGKLDYLKDEVLKEDINPVPFIPGKANEIDITCTGYINDLNTLKRVATPEVYNQIIDALGVDFDSVPKLNIVAGDKDDIEYGDGQVDVLCNAGSTTAISSVLSSIIIALISTRFPNLKDTIVPKVIADVLVTGVGYLCDYISDLINTYTLKGLLEKLGTMTIPEIFQFLKQSGKVESVDDIVDESKTITAASLTNSLKYRNSTKIKKANNKLKNQMSKLQDDIVASTDASISSNNKKDDNNDTDEVKISESLINALNGDSYIVSGDYITIFEDATYDPMLKKILYTERMVKRKEVIELLNRVKSDMPFIKYAYLDLNRYAQKNLFVDLYYYNQAFFKNNIWKLKKGFDIYLELLDRLINDKRIINAGYRMRTVFIPVNDWHRNPSTKMWLFKEDINPISIIYELMLKNPNGLAKLFKDVRIVFFSNNNYFTMDFNDVTNSKRNSIKFKNFIVKINNGEEFDTEDIDTSENTPTKDAIKADIIDKIEISKGVDLTAANAEVKKSKKSNPNANTKVPVRSDAKDKSSEEEPEENIDKLVANASDARDKSSVDKETMKTIASKIDQAADGATDTDEALDNMDDDLDLKELISGLDSMKDDTVNIDIARAERMTNLERELLDKSIKGRSIRDIIGDNNEKVNKELPESDLPVASPNEEWHHMKYMNFSKTYDVEKDIVKAFQHFSTVSRPLAIRNIKVEDNSTSEDRLDLYTVEYEDYRGKRFTIKLDIPKIKNDRFLLRGYLKNIQTQFFNMPIIKTDLDTCQIVTNYKKIIMFRFNTALGKSLPTTGRFVKAANKYTGKKIKFTGGDNSRICAKYVLPMDYIDLSSAFTTIETDNIIVYFDQDEIRKLYDINNGLGTPYAYDKKTKQIMYYSDKETIPFTYILVDLMQRDDPSFSEVYEQCKASTRSTYTKAKIMSAEMPLIIVCAYSEGLTKVMKKACISYELKDKLSSEYRNNGFKDYIRFSDGYLIYDIDYNSSLLMSGLKDCDTLSHSYTEIDDRNMYLDFLDNYGGRIKADGMDNFYDCEIDPITKETLEYYKMPTDYISILLYANRLLADNKFIRHTDTSSRRARRYELVAAYTYQVMSEVYGTYANSLKHNRTQVPFSCKQSAVIDKIMADTTSGDYSVNNLINDIETTNSITYKGLSGMNSDRSYSLDKRTYDASMVGVIGMSTGFSGNVGITRQATLDMGIEGERGYVKDNKGKVDNLNSARVLTATEAVMPFITTHDDPMRVAMSFIQTSKHAVRTEESDPLLVTNGADEALAYICSDQFAHKAKNKGVIKELDENGMIIQYDDGSEEYVNLKETIEKNSDGGFYVPLKLDADPKLKVGSKIKPGQIVAYDRLSLSNSLGESDNLAYNVGKLAKIAIINTDEGFEDSGVMTEEMAKKLACRIITKEDCILNKNTNIYNVAQVGQEIEEGDALLVWQTPYDEEEVNSLLKALANDKEAVSELGKHVVKSEVTGRLVGMKIYRTVDDSELSDSLKKLVRQYEKPITELKKKLEKEGIDYTDLPANYPLDATGKLKNAYDSILIEFYVEYVDIVGVGDKITYNAANKAIISKVIPEGKEPYTDSRPNEHISAFVSVTSIQKRMVQSTVTYGALQKLMVELDRTCKDMAGIPYDDSTV